LFSRVGRLSRGRCSDDSAQACAARRYPDIRTIFSQAGGTMPFLIERYDTTDSTVPPLKSPVPEGFHAMARTFFYDTAQTSNPVALTPSRSRFADRLRHRLSVPHHVRARQGARRLSDLLADELRAIYRENAVRLLPQRAG
jgi:6-methylsalicylate decarboxylase